VATLVATATGGAPDWKLLQALGGNMHHGAAAWRTVAQASRLRARARHQFPERGGHLRMNRKNQRRAAQNAHPREVGERIELRLWLNQVVEHMRGGRSKQEGVAIRGASPDLKRTHGPGRSRLVVEHHRLAKLLPQRGGVEPSERVGGPTRGERDHHPQRPGGPGALRQQG
jgi:hypothetical protein